MSIICQISTPIYSLVKDTFEKYSSTDTDTYFQKYLQILSNTFKYFFF